MKTFAATKRTTPPARRAPAPAPSTSSAALRADIRETLHGSRLQPKLTAGAPGDNVIRRYKLSPKFCTLTNENKRIRAAHKEAVARVTGTIALLSGSLTTPQKDLLKKYFGKKALGNIGTIKKHYRDILAALNGDYTYYCVDGSLAPEVCDGATNAQTMGKCGAGTVLRDDGFFHKAITTDVGDVALCMDRMRKFSVKGLANIIIHENLHRSGVCGHYAYCTDQRDGECANPRIEGHCGSLAKQDFIARNPDSYGCFAIQVLTPGGSS